MTLDTYLIAIRLSLHLTL